MKRVPPSKRTRERIDELLTGGTSEGSPLSELVRLPVEQIVEEALEAKVDDLLGRGYYERSPVSEGHRNGYRRGRLQTSEGEVSYAVPQLRGVDAGEVRSFRHGLAGRTEELEHHLGEQAPAQSLRQGHRAHSELRGGLRHCLGSQPA